MTVVQVITIDGPSGAGKGTLCKALAETLQWHLLDSGAIYRVLALLAMRHKVTIDSEEALVPLATYLNVRFGFKHSRLDVTLEGEDVSQIIRNENIGNIAAQIAVFPLIRKILLRNQRAFRVAPGLIADGRDMGTVVFPDALVKIFLHASLEKRIYRRIQQLQEKGFSVNFNHLVSNIKKRDDRDYNRIVAPLIPAPGALVLNSTCLTVSEMIAKALAHIRQIIALYLIIQ